MRAPRLRSWRKWQAGLGNAVREGPEAACWARTHPGGKGWWWRAGAAPCSPHLKWPHRDLGPQANAQSRALC